MKVKEGFILRTICGQHVISGEGTSNVNFSRLISLNESAAYLWQNIVDKEFTVDTLTDLLTAEYEVDAETARKDAEALVAKWLEVGIIE